MEETGSCLEGTASRTVASPARGARTATGVQAAGGSEDGLIPGSRARRAEVHLGSEEDTTDAHRGH